MRRSLVAVSLTVHLAAVFGLFVAGFWRIDRLEAPRRTIDLAVAPPPPPAPSGGPAAATPEPFTKKKPRVIPKAITQPAAPDPETTPVAPAQAASTGDGGTGTGGAGIGSGHDPNASGDCVGDHCGTADVKPETKRTEPIVDTPIPVPPTVIRGMRLSGETQIQPPDVEKTALLRSGKTRATATVKVCVGETGNIATLTMYKGSGYAGWDTAILSALRNWRYKPHRIGDRAVTVCGMVTFIYEIH